MIENLVRVEPGTAQAHGVEWVFDAQGLEHLNPELTPAGCSIVFERLFPEGAPRHWYETLSGPLLLQVCEPLRGVRWEAMHDGRGFVALTRGLVRVVPKGAGRPDVAPLSHPMRVLFALASPVYDPRFEADDPRQPAVFSVQDRVDLLRDIEGLGFPAQFHVRRHISAVQLEEVLATGFDVLHLAAHGNVDAVALERRNWTCDPVLASDLTLLCTRYDLRLVVLESCCSAAPDAARNAPSLAEAVVLAGTPFAVAMSGSVHGELASIFTNHFYQNLADGHDLFQSCRLARLRMNEAAQDVTIARGHWLYPVLYVNASALAKTAPRLVQESVGRVSITGEVAPWPDGTMRPSTTFVGRRRELVEIAAALDPEATAQTRKEKLLLTGHGGIGKTELALQAAERLRALFPDGIVCVSGRDMPAHMPVAPAGADAILVIRSDQQLLLRLAAGLGLEFESDIDEIGLIRAISGRANASRVLIVLDNLDPVAGSPAVVALMRSLGGRCRVLATSRYTLPGLDLPSLDVLPLLPGDAAAMVNWLAEGKGIDWQLNGPALTEACLHTPLAISLAVSLIARGRPEERVIDDFRTVHGSDVEQLLEYAFGRVLAEATPDEHLVFECAALYHGPVRRSALRAASGLTEDAFDQAVEGCLRLSLLATAIGQGGSHGASSSGAFWTWLGILPLARVWAERQLASDPSAGELRCRAARECAEFVNWADDITRGDAPVDPARTGSETPDFADYLRQARRSGLELLELEAPSAFAFAVWAFETEQWPLVFDYGQALARYMTMRNMGPAMEELGQMAVEAARRMGDEPREASALAGLAGVHDELGHWDQALECRNLAIAIRRRSGDRVAEAGLLSSIAYSYTQAGRLGEAQICCEQALQTFREIGDRDGEAGALNQLGIICNAVHNWADGVGYLKQARDIFHDLGEGLGEEHALCNLGDAYEGLERWEEAADCFGQSLNLARQLGDWPGEGRALYNLGHLCTDQCQWEEASRYFQQSLAVRGSLRDRRGCARALTNLAECHLRLGREYQASQCHADASDLFRELGDRQSEAKALLRVAETHFSQQKLDEAIPSVERALAIFKELNDCAGEGRALTDLAGICALQENWERSVELMDQALAILAGQGHETERARTLEMLGVAHHELQHWDESIRCHEQAVALYKALGDAVSLRSSLGSLVERYTALERWGEATACHEQSQPLSESGDTSGDALLFSHLGAAYEAQARYDEAIEHLSVALEISRRLGDEHAIGETLMRLGYIQDEQGQFETAIDSYQEALAASRKAGDRRNEGGTLSNLGIVYSRQGRHVEATECYERALSILRGLGDLEWSVGALSNMALSQEALHLDSAATGTIAEAMHAALLLQPSTVWHVTGATAKIARDMAERRKWEAMMKLTDAIGEELMQSAEQRFESPAMDSCVTLTAQAVTVIQFVARAAGQREDPVLSEARGLAELVDTVTDASLDLVSWMAEVAPELRKREPGQAPTDDTEPSGPAALGP